MYFLGLLGEATHVLDRGRILSSNADREKEPSMHLCSVGVMAVTSAEIGFAYAAKLRTPT